MYDIERTRYGIRINFDGDMTVKEMQDFKEECKQIIDSLDDGFGVVADFRGIDAFPDEASELLADTMAYSSQNGVGRSAVAVDSSILGLQQEQLGDDTGVESEERVIDATRVDDWESQALDWVENGVEPDT